MEYASSAWRSVLGKPSSTYPPLRAASRIRADIISKKLVGYEIAAVEVVSGDQPDRGAMSHLVV